jgi:glycosyltransferase involved in cell wall biosynthesis
MPRILSVNSYHYRRGGSDVVYLEHAALMEKLGWENGFFSMQHPKNYPTEWSRYFIDELEFGSDYSAWQKLVMAGKAVYSFEAQRRLRGLIQDFAPDVAHLHCIYHHLSPSILPVLSKAGIPTVMTAHDLKIACPAYKMLNRTGVCERCKDGSVINVIKYRCVRDSLGASVIVAAESGLQRMMQTYRKHLDKVVVPSRFFMNKFIEWGWPEDQFAYVPNYVHADAFSPASDAGDYFLYFGRLAPEKGIATLLRAAKLAGVHVKVVGTGPEEQALKALNVELNEPAVFLGYRTGDELHDLIRGSRAVVLPSEWYENAPMSVLESFALAKPVIGAEIGGIPEMVTEDVGATFTSRDVEGLAEGLRAMASLADSQVVDMGRRAREKVENEFSQHRYVDTMLDVYAGLGAK